MLFSDTYSKEMKTCPQKPCVRTFLAALFIIAYKWKQPISVKRRMDKQTCIFIQRNNTPQKKNQTINTSGNMDKL